MLVDALLIIFLLVCFYLLGRSADLVIINIKQIGEKLGIKIFFLGLILGILTSLPELSVGINSIINKIEEISLGNLLGGIIVLLGFILGLSAMLNRKIETDGKIKHFVPIVAYLLLPLLLGIDGQLNYVDGIVMIGLYLVLIIYLYSWNKGISFVSIEIIRNGKILKNVFMSLFGIVMVIVFSNLIVRLTLLLLADIHIPQLLLGLILFSIGTNLPEIIVTLRSWKKNIEDLSISNLIGSATGNILIIGIFSIIVPFEIEINYSYLVLLLFFLILFVLLSLFYRTEKELSRKEGFVLVSIYLLFFITQFYLLARSIN